MTGTSKTIRLVLGAAIIALVLVTLVPMILSLLSSHREPFTTSPFRSLPTCDAVAQAGIPIRVDASPGPTADRVGSGRYTGDAYWPERLFGVLPFRNFARKSVTERRCGSTESAHAWLEVSEYRSGADAKALARTSGGSVIEQHALDIPGADEANVETELWKTGCAPTPEKAYCGISTTAHALVGNTMVKVTVEPGAGTTADSVARAQPLWPDSVETLTRDLVRVAQHPSP